MDTGQLQVLPCYNPWALYGTRPLLWVAVLL